MVKRNEEVGSLTLRNVGQDTFDELNEWKVQEAKPISHLIEDLVREYLRETPTTKLLHRVLQAARKAPGYRQKLRLRGPVRQYWRVTWR
jgi:hypothetical protein